MTELNELSYQVIGAAMRVHPELGPGMREAVYEAALVDELRREGNGVREQVRVPIEIGGRRISRAAQVDLVVDEKLVVEIKATRGIGMHDVKQALHPCDCGL